MGTRFWGGWGGVGVGSKIKKARVVYKKWSFILSYFLIIPGRVHRWVGSVWSRLCRHPPENLRNCIMTYGEVETEGRISI